MAVPKHIILFAEKSMEQAGLLTFAKNLGLAGAKFLSANRNDGTSHILDSIPAESLQSSKEIS